MVELVVSLGEQTLVTAGEGLHAGASAAAYGGLLRHALRERSPSVRVEVRTTRDSAPLAVTAVGCRRDQEAAIVEAALEVAREILRSRRWVERVHADEPHALLWVEATVSGMWYAVEEHGLDIGAAARRVTDEHTERLLVRLRSLGSAKVEALVDEYVLDLLAPRLERAPDPRVPVVAARELAAWYLARHRASPHAGEVARIHALLESIATGDADRSGHELAASWIARFPTV